MSTDVTPRVNSARLGDHVGRTVRLVCKVERIANMSAIVRASDQGQVEVKLGEMMQPDLNSYLEVIGKVVDANVVSMVAFVQLGDDLDMSLVNDCIEMTHDARFASMF